MFNKNLKYYRLKNNLSKKALASLCGVSSMLITYYENGVWRRSFGLTGEQINANEVVETAVEIYDGTYYYNVTVASYAGVIDELGDFATFFNNDPSATAPNVYGYYVVTKNLGTGVEELALTQTATTDYKPNNGFNGVLDVIIYLIFVNIRL